MRTLDSTHATAADSITALALPWRVIEGGAHLCRFRLHYDYVQQRTVLVVGDTVNRCSTQPFGWNTPVFPSLFVVDSTVSHVCALARIVNRFIQSTLH